MKLGAWYAAPNMLRSRLLQEQKFFLLAMGLKVIEVYLKYNAHDPPPSSPLSFVARSPFLGIRTGRQPDNTRRSPPYPTSQSS
jgi:hypothetical protein